jgi:polyisoprenoid-binding protein YceI
MRAFLMTLPLALGLFMAACADNPADGVTPARVSDASEPVAEAAEAAAEALETGDIIPEGPVSDTLGEEDSADDLGYLDTPSGAGAVDLPYLGSSAGDEGAGAAARVFVINPGNSKIEFECSKVTRSHVGGFNSFSGEIQLSGDSPEGASLIVAIRTDSIWTDTDQLTGHLKSPDFFDVATYPESNFALTAVTATETGYDVTGDLTLHGVTKTLTFPAAISIGDASVTATSEFVIDRFDFGIEYAGAADDLIRREVVIRLNIQADAA